MHFHVVIGVQIFGIDCPCLINFEHVCDTCLQWLTTYKVVYLKCWEATICMVIQYIFEILFSKNYCFLDKYYLKSVSQEASGSPVTALATILYFFIHFLKAFFKKFSRRSRQTVFDCFVNSIHSTNMENNFINWL